MVENIVAYIYSITGLIFFIAWQMNFSSRTYGRIGFVMP
tara:strand:- start:186 stop:302 length:117 start_codon:yes stop_codon:yes gene_type:complete